MSKSLFVSAVSKFSAGVLLVGALIFWPAGTWAYTNGWLFMSTLFLPMLAVGIVMMKRNPTLLQKRLNAKENQSGQQVLVKLCGLMFAVGFVVAGLGVRFDWYMLPTWASAVGVGLFLIAYALYAEVLRENAYLSRTVEVQEGQTVIDSGLYGIVRHPMYSATLLLFLSMPLILGSVYALGVFAAYPFLIVGRIRNEEKVLKEQLEGYGEYMKRVRYRLIPFVW